MMILPIEDNGDDHDEATVRCHDCSMIASSEEEDRANGFCHVKVFDSRRRVGDDDEDQQEATGRLKDGYYWLCPDCFHHIRETLPVAGGDFDKFSHRCRHLGMKEKEESSSKNTKKEAKRNRLRKL